MTQLSKFMLQVGFVAGCFCSGAMASYLDFTDNSTILSLTEITNGYEGSVDGVSFTLTAARPGVNFNQGYDGSLNTGCQSAGGPLECDGDGAGIGNDEITGLTPISGQIMTLEFETAVYISSLDFLDLYLNADSRLGGEQAMVTIDGTTPSYLVNATGTSGDGGYANLDLLALGGPVLGQTIEFTSFLGGQLQDDRDNDYAFAGISVSAVPIPAAAWLFGTALIGLVGFSKRKKTA